MKVIDRINAVAAAHPAEVYFDFLPNDSKINKALRRANAEERLSLAKDLFNLWCNGTKEEHEATFGKIENKRCYGKLMFTLTADGRQFRIWYGRPNSIRRTHVDSMGRNLLIGVYGDPELVKSYVDGFLESYRLRPIELPNGTKLFMRWGDDHEPLGHMGA